MSELRINQSQIKLWNECREHHRMNFLENRESIVPRIHYHFGSVIHKMAQGYWAGLDYMKSAHQALELSQELDARKLSAKNRTKWVEMCETILPITTIYYGYHGEKTVNEPALVNEKLVELKWGHYAGFDVTLHGTIDRISHSWRLIDTKTASAVGKDWKADLKKRLLREPQMGFYFHLAEKVLGKQPTGCEYEIVVKSYRGSDPSIEVIDVTKEVRAFQEIFMQQLDWTVREICEFYAHAQNAKPWPMSNTACISMWGECEFLPVCSGKATVNDSKFYQVRER